MMTPEGVIRPVALAIGTLSLLACSASDEGGDGESSEATSTSTSQELAAPGTDERVAMIAAFRDAAPSNCPFYKESVESNADGDLAGAWIQTCTGRFSQIANFNLITSLEGGPFESGTVLATMGANGQPGAFDPLWDLIGDLAQMTDGEVARLRREMPTKLRFAGNLYSIDYEPLMTTKSGVRLSYAGNKLQQGTLTVKIDPPR